MNVQVRQDAFMQPSCPRARCIPEETKCNMNMKRTGRVPTLVQRQIHTRMPTLKQQKSQQSRVLPPESSRHLVRPPVHLHLTRVHILINPHTPLIHIAIPPLALLEHLENKITADAGIISVAKVLVDAFLERLDALADLLCVVRVDQLLEDGARVRRALGNGQGAGAALGQERFSRFDEFLIDC
jgi:hypothetical protein